jgi:hemerythrin-like domain-containing protein
MKNSINSRNKSDLKFNRRTFLNKGVMTLAGMAIIQPSNLLASPGEEVSPLEDLMREHGILRRILFIYEEVVIRLGNKKDFPPEVIPESANIIRTFIEDYHEKLEEKYLFPLFEKAGKLTDLVKILLEQHQGGRILTDMIITTAGTGLKNESELSRLSEYLPAFIRMYGPHAAREDTVLFPAFHYIIPEKEYDVMGDAFEDKEHELFGEDGFNTIVNKIAELEKMLGLYDLAQFTYKL